MNTQTLQSSPIVILKCQVQLALTSPNEFFGGNWDLKKNTLPGEKDILESVPFLEPDEEITGEELEKRTQAMKNLAGQLHAQHLVSQVEKIPDEWSGLIHVFLGTDWRGHFGCRPIPCLGFHKRKWNLFFIFLGNHLTSRFQLVRLKRPF